MTSFGTPEPGRILLVTRAFDPHADELLTLLRYLGEEPVRLNTEAIPGEALLSFRFTTSSDAMRMSEEEERCRATLFVDGRFIDSVRVAAVWWRRPGRYQFGGMLEPSQETLALQETAQAMMGFWLALSASGCYWMSEPGALARAGNLLEQVRRAASLGFRIPRSLLSTRPAEVRVFCQATAGRVVYRLLSAQLPLPEDQRARPGPAAMLLTEEHLASLDDLLLVPALFQERLPALRFVQVVVIGTRLFAAQSHGDLEAVSHWWDPQVSACSYTPVELPVGLRDRCLRLVQSFGLEFAVVVLAQGALDAWYFVSLDALGSFLWLEQQCPDLPLAETLARQLITGATSSRSGSPEERRS